jgi:hypothetical protein
MTIEKVTDLARLERQLDERRAVLMAQLPIVESERDRAALDAESGVENARGRYSALDREMQDLHLQLRRIEAARAMAQRQGTSRAISSRRKNAEHAASRAITAAAERVALAEKLDAAFASLGALLAEWHERSQIITGDVKTALNGLAGDAEHRRRISGPVFQAAQGRSAMMAGALAHAAARAGIGEVGIGGENWVVVSAPGTTKDAYTFVAAAEREADRLSSHLARMVEGVQGG